MSCSNKGGDAIREDENSKENKKLYKKENTSSLYSVEANLLE